MTSDWFLDPSKAPSGDFWKPPDLVNAPSVHDVLQRAFTAPPCPFCGERHPEHRPVTRLMFPDEPLVCPLHPEQ